MTLLFSFTGSMSLMFLAWLLYCHFNNPSLIDVFWGLNILFIGMINLAPRETDALKMIAMGLLLTWGLRLSIFLFLTRIAQGERDRRYEAMSNDWRNKKIGFLAQYLLQGLLAFVIAIPFYTMSVIPSYNAFTIIAVGMIIVGLIGESIADNQLRKFKQNRVGGICSVGLWRYSRHPNYFFECVIWAGFSVMGSGEGIGLLAPVSIATLFIVMWFITIPITERESLKKRGGEYQRYIDTTSCFVPWKLKA